MLQSLLDIKQLPKHLDATDGLAAAMCHFYQKNSNKEKKQYGSWQSFLKNNPDKIK